MLFILLLFTSFNVISKPLKTYNDGCLDRGSKHILVEMISQGHTVRVIRCKGNLWSIRGIRKQRRTVLSRIYRFNNRNAYIRQYKAYLRNLGLYISYTTRPYWK